MARIVKASRTGAGTVALTLRVRTLLRAVAGDQISTSMRIEGKDFRAGRPPRPCSLRDHLVVGGDLPAACDEHR